MACDDDPMPTTLTGGVLAVLVLSACSTDGTQVQYVVRYGAGYAADAGEKAIERCAELPGAKRDPSVLTLPPEHALTVNGGEDVMEQVEKCLADLPAVATVTKMSSKTGGSPRVIYPAKS